MPSLEYWAKRFNMLEQSQHDRGAEAFSEIDRKYRRAIREIERKIAVWYQRFADNNGITLQEAQKWLTEKELEEFKWDVQEYIRYGQENAVDGAWEKKLENASARYHINRLEALKVQCQQDIEVLFGSQKDIFDQLLSDVYTFGYYHTAFEIHKGVGVGWDFATLDRKTISKVINKPWAVDGKNFSDRIWLDKQKLLSELDTTLTQNIILGQDPQKAINAISKKMNVSKANAGRLVMTEKAYFSSEGQKDCFKELDVEQYEIVATLDSRTSEICRNMDGKVFKIPEWKVGVTAPPFHPWCRTTTVPHFDDEFDVGERAARSADGQTYYVPGNMTYKEWKQSLESTGKLEKTYTEFSAVMGLRQQRERLKIGKVIENEKGTDIIKVQQEKISYQGIPKTWKKLGKDKDPLKGVNPYYRSGDPAYKENCPNCVVAYEMRKREHDVMAKTMGKNHYLNYHPEKAWKEPDIHQTKASGLQEILDAFKKWPEGARAEIAVQWKRSGAHVFVGEKIKNEVHFLDVQSGTEYSDSIFSIVKEGETRFWRIDELEPSDRGITACEVSK